MKIKILKSSLFVNRLYKNMNNNVVKNEKIILLILRINMFGFKLVTAQNIITAK